MFRVDILQWFSSAVCFSSSVSLVTGPVLSLPRQTTEFIKFIVYECIALYSKYVQSVGFCFTFDLVERNNIVYHGWVGV